VRIAEQPYNVSVKWVPTDATAKKAENWVAIFVGGDTFGFDGKQQKAARAQRKL
jgi:hypothetical protein